MAFTDFIMPGLAGIGLLSQNQRADRAQKAADRVSAAYQQMTMREKEINDQIRQGVLQRTANLGTTLSEGQQALGAFDPTGFGFFDQSALDSLQAEYLAAAQRDTAESLDRAGSQLQAQDLRRGVADGTPGEDTRRRLMETAADVNRDANLKARQDAINEYKQILAMQEAGQGMQESRRGFALDELQSVLEPQIKLESTLLNTQTPLNSMATVDTHATKRLSDATTDAASQAQGFGSSLANLLRERKVDARLAKYGTPSGAPLTIAEAGADPYRIKYIDDDGY